MKTGFKIEEMDRSLPFGVPENYFEQFSAKMESQIKTKKSSKNIYLKSWKYVVAAMLAGSIVVTKFYFSSPQSKNALVENKNENYETYVLSQVEEAQIIDTYLSEKNK